jgi:NADH-quinone oxidoreductase subunit L
MMGMAFFGKESRHLEDMQNEGHHLHEVGKSMWIPFGALAVATISIGLIGFIFEEQLHHFLGEYLADSFGIAEEEPNGSESLARVEGQESTSFLGLNSAALVGSVGAFGVGGALGYVFYIARRADPGVISRNVFTRAIWKFLYNRWYLNSALYWGSVIVPLAIYRIIWRYFENVVIDGMNPAFQFSMAYFSRVVKAAQTGITQTYLYIFAVGIVIVTMLLFL